MILLSDSSTKRRPTSEYSDEQGGDLRLLGQPDGVEERNRCDHDDSAVREQEKIRRQSNDSGSSRDGHADGLTMLKR